jgi:hypothetical protein
MRRTEFMTPHYLQLLINKGLSVYIKNLYLYSKQ